GDAFTAGDRVLFAGEWVSRNALFDATAFVASGLGVAAVALATADRTGTRSRSALRAVADALSGVEHEERVAWATLVLASEVKRRGAQAVEEAAQAEPSAVRAVERGLAEVLAVAATILAERARKASRRGSA